MTKIPTFYRKIFVIFFVVIFLFTSFVIDSYSLFYIPALRTTWFFDAWRTFIFPGLFLFARPLLFLYKIASFFVGGCPGMLDGGPCEPYFYFIFSVLIAIFYASMITGFTYVIRKVYHRFRI